MKKIAFLFIAAMTVLSFGCKKKNEMKEAMAKMDGFKTQMCACKASDKACAEKVEKDMNSYLDSMKGKEKDKDMKPSPDDEKHMTTTMTDYGKCRQTAMGADPAMAPPADPAAAPPAAPAGGDPAMAPPAGGAPPPAGEMKKEEPKKEEMKK
jgi:hypothetical protein